MEYGRNRCWVKGAQKGVVARKISRSDHIGYHWTNQFWRATLLRKSPNLELVGGLVAIFYVSMHWEFDHPN